MKKTLIVLLTAVLAISMLFVSCSNETKLDERVNVSFGVSQGRSLTSSASFADFNDFDWWYKATTRSTDFNYGQTNGWTKLENGLATNLELSQGIWNFELCAVAKNTEAIVEGQTSNNTVKYYYGVRTGVLVQKTDGNIIPIAISVTPGSTGNGTIVISKNIIVNKKNGQTSSINANKYEIKNKNNEAITYAGTISTSDISNLVPSGNYSVTISYQEPYTGANNSYILRALEPIDVTVYDSSTIRIEGTIDEATQSIIINPINTYMVEASTTVQKEGDAFNDVAVIAPLTPAMTSAISDKTIVTVPSSLIQGKTDKPSEADVKVSVAVTPVAKAAIDDSFTVSAGNVAAAAIDLTLYMNGVEVTNYPAGEQAHQLIVETYVAKNLLNPKVTYNGSIISETPEYNPNTGYLKFTTTHFSTFVVESSSKALIGDKAYDSLSDAVANSANGDVVTLIADAFMDSSLIINGGKQLTIDLNGFNISAPNKVIQITHANVTLTGKGTVYERDDDQYGALIVKGSGSDNGANYTVVTVEENVTLRGWSGIFVAKDEAGTYLNYGLVVNLYGKVMIPGEDDHATRNGPGINVNGYNNNITGNVSVFNIEGASIKGNAGIYAAGYAEWNISDSDIEGNNSAIEIRAGRLNIDSGRFVALDTPTSCVANGNGSTTVGAAIAVAQHTTKLPINVTISGGTFEGYTAFYEDNPQNNPDVDIAKVNLNITGGIFNAINDGTTAIYSADKTGFISGGTFSSKPVNNYLVPNAVATQEITNWTVKVDESIIARIGTTLYSSLSDAINAVNNETGKERITLEIVKSGEYDPFTLNRGNVTVQAGDGINATIVVSSTKKMSLGNNKTRADNVTIKGLKFDSKDGTSILFNTLTDNLILENCFFVNSGTVGGTALYIHYPNIEIKNCTFINWKSGYYTCGDNSAAGKITFTGNTFNNVKVPIDGYWGKTATDSTMITINGNTINPASWNVSYIQLWDYAQYQRWSGSKESDRQGSALKAILKDNICTGNVVLYLTHNNWFNPSDVTVTNNGNMQIQHRYLVEVELGTVSRDNVIIKNYGGSEITAFDTNNKVIDKGGKNVIYSLPAGNYWLLVTMDNTSKTYQFSVNEMLTPNSVAPTQKIVLSELTTVTPN